MLLSFLGFETTKKCLPVGLVARYNLQQVPLPQPFHAPLHFHPNLASFFCQALSRGRQFFASFFFSLPPGQKKVLRTHPRPCFHLCPLAHIPPCPPASLLSLLLCPNSFHFHACTFKHDFFACFFRLRSPYFSPSCWTCGIIGILKGSPSTPLPSCTYSAS